MPRQTRARSLPKEARAGGSVRSTSRKNRVDLAKARGARDFFAFISRNQPEWALLAVEAPIEVVSRALAVLHNPEDWERDIGQKRIAPVRRPCFVLQLRGHRWSLVVHSIAWVDREGVRAVREDALALSRLLGTRAISFTGEEAPDSMGYTLLGNGRLAEEAAWEGGELSFFWSELRPRPRAPRNPEALVDGFFRDQGLYVPTCSLDSDGHQLWLALRDLPVSAVVRADFLALER